MRRFLRIIIRSDLTIGSVVLAFLSVFLAIRGWAGPLFLKFYGSESSFDSARQDMTQTSSNLPFNLLYFVYCTFAIQCLAGYAYSD